jgi:hypothetical protein
MRGQHYLVQQKKHCHCVMNHHSVCYISSQCFVHKTMLTTRVGGDVTYYILYISYAWIARQWSERLYRLGRTDATDATSYVNIGEVQKLGNRDHSYKCTEYNAHYKCNSVTAQSAKVQQCNIANTVQPRPQCEQCKGQPRPQCNSGNVQQCNTVQPRPSLG